MATGFIEIFKTEITPEKNAVIDDLDLFLDSKCIKTYDSANFQYHKIELNTTFNLAIGQEYVGKAIGNYCRLTQDDKKYYYFITKADWVSTGAVRLTVSMDTLNTYRNDLVFTDKTTIEREHKNRLATVNPRDNRHIGLKTCYRIVDKQPENISLPKEMISRQKLIETEDLNWYLIYKTRDSLTPENIGNPVQCSLIADKRLPVAYKGGAGSPYVFTASSFGTDKYYYLSFLENTLAQVKIVGLETILREFQGQWPDVITKSTNFCISAQAPAALGNVTKALIIHSDGSKIYVECDGDTLVSLDHATTRPVPIEFTCNKLEIANLGQLRISPIKYGYENIPSIPNVNYYDGTQKAYTISIEDLDKTDPKLMKIIRLPYAPIEVIKNEKGLYQFPAGWSFENGLMNLDSNNLSAEFLNKIGDVDITDEMITETYVSPKVTVVASNESKMYNSEFYTVKGLYDSFDKDIKLENISVNGYNLTAQDKISFPVYFKPTNTINSKFAFKFGLENEGYDPNKHFSFTRTTDYDQYLLITRNNEESIFNNAYINYVNSGYNYDKKQKAMALTQNLLGIGSGLAQTGATLGTQKATVGLATGVLSAAALSAGFGAVNAITNTIFSQIQAQQAIDQKLNELSRQSTSVSGSDDVDLLQFYNGNKLQLIKYDLEPLSKRNVANLFYYTGYNHPVQEIPETNTRYWFNFLKCNPVFKNETTSAYNDYLDDIRVRFNKGVTVYHHHPEIDIGWDINQEYENYEYSVIDTSYLPLEKFTSIGATNFIYDPNEEAISWTRTTSIDGSYESISVRYTNSLGELQIEDSYGDNPNSMYIENVDFTKPFSARRTNKFREDLSSDWEPIQVIPAPTEDTVLTTDVSTLSDVTIRGAYENDNKVSTLDYLGERGRIIKLAWIDYPDAGHYVHTAALLKDYKGQPDTQDPYIYRENIEVAGQRYGKWESFHFIESDEEEPNWHSNRVILTDPIKII